MASSSSSSSIFKISTGDSSDSEYSDSDSDYVPSESSQSEEIYDDLTMKDALLKLINDNFSSPSSSPKSKKRKLSEEIKNPPAPKKPKVTRKTNKSSNLPPLDVSKFEPLPINNISDMIKVATQWKKFKQGYNLNNEMKPTYTEIEYDKLQNIIPQLRKLNNMIGMDEIKVTLVEQILYFIQNLHGNEMMNIVLTGDPGVGKTTVGEILGNIYKKLGVLTKGTFHCAKRTDFIAEYLGQTSHKTQKFLEKCIGGVIFIDEAYSIGTDLENDSDSYARECVDTLNRFLSENRDIICIIAGYEKNIKRNIFGLNAGLERRFPWRFNIKRYSSVELRDIFLYRIKFDKWKTKFRKKEIDVYFKQHEKKFKNNGGDCEILLNKCKIEHGKRVFQLPEDEKKNQRCYLTLDDIKNGINVFVREYNKNNVNNDRRNMSLMYI